jgi:mRNA interferase MazF
MDRKIQRGDMFYANLMLGIGSEQSGYRPVLIIQNDTGNRYSKTVIIANITSKMTHKSKMPTHCRIKAQQGLGQDSLVLLEQIRTIDRKRLKEYIGRLDSESMNKVNTALAVSVGLELFHKRREANAKNNSITSYSLLCMLDGNNSHWHRIQRQNSPCERDYAGAFHRRPEKGSRNVQPLDC